MEEMTTAIKQTLRALALLLLSCAASASDHEALLDKLAAQLQMTRSTPSGQRIWIPQSKDLHLLVGVRRSEIFAKLGDPTTCTANDCMKAEVVEYCFCPTDRPSGQVLAVKFDGASRVASASWGVRR